MDAPLRSAVADALHSPVAGAAQLHGGDVATSWRVDLTDGRRVMVKTHPSAPPAFFSTEAASLRWLRDADAVAVPEVLAVSDGVPNFLALEWIDAGRKGSASAFPLVGAAKDAGFEPARA